MIHSIYDLQSDNDVLAEEFTAAMLKFFNATAAKDTDDRVMTNVVISIKSIDRLTSEELVVEKIEGQREVLTEFGLNIMLGADDAPAVISANAPFISQNDFVVLV